MCIVQHMFPSTFTIIMHLTFATNFYMFLDLRDILYLTIIYVWWDKGLKEGYRFGDWLLCKSYNNTNPKHDWTCHVVLVPVITAQTAPQSPTCLRPGISPSLELFTHLRSWQASITYFCSVNRMSSDRRKYSRNANNHCFMQAAMEYDSPHFMLLLMDFSRNPNIATLSIIAEIQLSRYKNKHSTFHRKKHRAKAK